MRELQSDSDCGSGIVFKLPQNVSWNSIEQQKEKKNSIGNLFNKTRWWFSITPVYGQVWLTCREQQVHDRRAAVNLEHRDIDRHGTPKISKRSAYPNTPSWVGPGQADPRTAGETGMRLPNCRLWLGTKRQCAGVGSIRVLSAQGFNRWPEKTHSLASNPGRKLLEAKTKPNEERTPGRREKFRQQKGSSWEEADFAALWQQNMESKAATDVSH